MVHVSIVNWVKGSLEGQKKLSWQVRDARDSPWDEASLRRIPSSLSASADVTNAKALKANAESEACYQGQTHGHEGFLLTAEEARAMRTVSPKNMEVVYPFLIGDDLLGESGGRPSRWVIDFYPRDEGQARSYKAPFQRIKSMVLPDREEAAEKEEERNAALPDGKKGNRHHENFLRRWWLLSYPRPELMERLNTLARYIVCSRVTKRPIFEFIDTSIHPNDALNVFLLEDDYSFGILQSGLHWAWFKARCSTLTARFRYTSDTVFDSFPWPQSPDAKQVMAISKAAVALRTLRRNIAARGSLTLRAMYASMEDSGKHPLKDAHAALDTAVRAAYGMGPRQDPLTFLLDLNAACAEREAKNKPVVGPGLPPGVSAKGLVTKDAVQPPSL